jgi:hypothetical protein
MQKPVDRGAAGVGERVPRQAVGFEVGLLDGVQVPAGGKREQVRARLVTV